MSTRWTRQWQAVGTSGKMYTVSLHDDDWFACSCPAWKFQKRQFQNRRDCQHILQIRLNLSHQLHGIVEVPLDQIEQGSMPERRIRINDKSTSVKSEANEDKE